MRHEGLLDILADERIHNALEGILRNSAEFYLAQAEHSRACDKLEKASLNKKQSKKVNRALSTANNCGAVYGAIAYRQGFKDGIRLEAELKEVRLSAEKNIN